MGKAENPLLSYRPYVERQWGATRVTEKNLVFFAKGRTPYTLICRREPDSSLELDVVAAELSADARLSETQLQNFIQSLLGEMRALRHPTMATGGGFGFTSQEQGSCPYYEADLLNSAMLRGPDIVGMAKDAIEIIDGLVPLFELIHNGRFVSREDIGLFLRPTRATRH